MNLYVDIRSAPKRKRKRDTELEKREEIQDLRSKKFDKISSTLVDQNPTVKERNFSLIFEVNVDFFLRFKTCLNTELSRINLLSKIIERT